MKPSKIVTQFSTMYLYSNQIFFLVVLRKYTYTKHIPSYKIHSLVIAM